jgi:hypothetical protein
MLLLLVVAATDAKPRRPSWLPRFGKQAAVVVEEPLPSSYYFSWTTFGFTHDRLPFLGYYFWIPALVLLGLLAVLAFVGYRLGAWDRPPFVLRAAGLAWSSTDDYWQQPPQSHNKHDTILYAILATTTDPRYGHVVETLLPATHAAVAAVVPATALTDAAARYGSTTTRASESSDKDSTRSTHGAPQPLSVALYFDDPHVTAAPRWALGWLVAASSHAQAKVWARAASRVLNNSDITTGKHKSNSGKHKSKHGPHQRGHTAATTTTTHHPLHAVRLGPGPILSARIPWRHVLTPVLASWLHWPRGFWRYHQEFPHAAAAHSPVAAEFFVTGDDNSNSSAWMDYVLFTGDISHTWQDCGYEAPLPVGKSL